MRNKIKCSKISTPTELTSKFYYFSIFLEVTSKFLKAIPT